MSDTLKFKSPAQFSFPDFSDAFFSAVFWTSLFEFHTEFLNSYTKNSTTTSPKGRGNLPLQNGVPSLAQNGHYFVTGQIF